MVKIKKNFKNNWGCSKKKKISNKEPPCKKNQKETQNKGKEDQVVKYSSSQGSFHR